MLFRVWDRQKKKWGTDTYYLNEDGDVLYSEHNDGEYYYMNPNTTDLEFNTGITLADGTETFYGDIIRFDDDNWYPGKHANGIICDRYVYAVLTKNFQLDAVNYNINIDTAQFFNNVEIVGNIHETELTDAMKIWIKE